MHNRRKADAKYKAKAKIVRHKFFTEVGSDCFICKREDTLKCHRKDWLKHQPFDEMSISKFLKEKTSNYARLCFQCHYGVHWLHNNFGLEWSDIIKLKR